MKDLSNKNVIRINKNGVQYLQFRKLLEYKDIITHAYSIGTDVNFRTARVNKQQLPENEFNKAIQDYKNLCNAINVDCILLLFFDPVTKTIANTHSGWKGTLQRISVKTVEKMINEFNSKPEDIICCICPSIRKCHFEVDRDVKEMFENEFKDLNINKNIDIMEKQKDKEKWNIDTVLINRIILEKTGLKAENIIDSGLCSVCNKELIHSFRVEKEGYGLNTAIISLIEK